MPDENDFKNYKSIEEYGRTLEGSKYYHSLYMKAVAHPIRKRILKIIFKHKRISYNDLRKILIEEQTISKEGNLNYNLEYLIKALCIEADIDKQTGDKYFKITQSGEVVDFLDD